MHSFKSDSCVDHLIVGFNDMLSSKTCEKEPTVASSVGVFHGKTPNWADLTYRTWIDRVWKSTPSILDH